MSSSSPSSSVSSSSPSSVWTSLLQSVKSPVVKSAFLVSLVTAAGLLYSRVSSYFTKDARVDLYSQSAYTVLSLADARIIYHRFHYGTQLFEQTTDKKELSDLIVCTDDEFATELKMLKGGLSNSNYMVRTNKGHQYLLKICEEKAAYELQPQLKALMILQRVSQVKVSYPLPAWQPNSELANKTEDEVTTPLFFCPIITKRPIVFYTYLNGANPKNPTNNILAEIAKEQAKLHTVDLETNKLSFLPKLPFGMFDFCPQMDDYVIGKKIEAHPFIAFLRPYLPIFQALAQENGLAAGIKQGILHGDLFLENVMFEAEHLGGNKEKLLGIIDFEELGRGPVVLDCAMTIVGCCYGPDQKLNESLTRAFLTAYHSIRPFTAREKELFIPFLKYALLAIAFWRFRQYHIFHPDSEQMRKDAYKQMVQRTENLDKFEDTIIQHILHGLK